MQDVDAFFGIKERPLEALKRRVGYALLIGGAGRGQASEIPLLHRPSPHLSGLRLIARAGERGARGDRDFDRRGVVVGTLRAGYGHYRIASAAYTWALARGRPAYLHDPGRIPSPESDLILRIDRVYSRLSRISSELGGWADRLWGMLTLQGGLGSLRLSCQLARALRPLVSRSD